MPSISNNNRFLLTISLVISIFVVQSVGYGWIIEQNFIKIEEGDTLWNISRQLLGDGSRYEEIWQNRLSPAKYKNPNLIFPGMLFRYVGKNIINKPGEVHHEFPNVPTENFNQIIENSNAAIIKIDLIQNDVKDIYRTLEKIEKHVGHPDESTRHFKQIIDNSNAAVIRIDLIQKEVIKLNNTLEKIEKKMLGNSKTPKNKKKPVDYLNGPTNDFKAIMDKGTVAIKNLNLIQNEVKTINNTLLELEKNIKNDSNLLKDVEKKNTKVLTELVSIATKIFKKMEHIIDEIQKIHSPGFWSTILDKLLLAAIAGAGGSLIVVVGTYLYEQYQTRRRLSILEKI